MPPAGVRARCHRQPAGQHLGPEAPASAPLSRSSACAGGGWGGSPCCAWAASSAPAASAGASACGLPAGGVATRLRRSTAEPGAPSALRRQAGALSAQTGQTRREHDAHW